MWALGIITLLFSFGLAGNSLAKIHWREVLDGNKMLTYVRYFACVVDVYLLND